MIVFKCFLLFFFHFIESLAATFCRKLEVLLCCESKHLEFIVVVVTEQIRKSEENLYIKYLLVMF